MPLTIDLPYLTTTLSALVQINSINPSLAPGGAGEGEAADYLAGQLKALGLEVSTYEPAPGRPSVVGRLKGTGQGKSLMLYAHVDTVGVDAMPDPFSGAVREGKVYGRGAYDMKGSVAACLAALKALIDAKAHLPGDILFVGVADEEYASVGISEVLKHVRADAAIVTEPTEMEICLAHKGFVWLEVEVLGRAAHGSRFDEGVDANMRMGRFLAELDKLEQELRVRPPHPLAGPPSLHVSLLRGGTELSMYAAQCQAHIERRTVPGETEAHVLSEINAIILRLTKSDPTFQATVKSLLVRDAMEIFPGSPIVKALTDAAEDILPKPPLYTGRPFWMDAALIAAAGIPTVVIGPTGAGAHAKEEWVTIDSTATLALILAQTAVTFTHT